MKKLLVLLVCLFAFSVTAYAELESKETQSETPVQSQVSEPEEKPTPVNNAPVVQNQVSEPKEKPAPVKNAPVLKKEVARYCFTLAVVNRSPTEALESYSPVEGESVFFFSELCNMNGTTVKHIWSKNDAEIFEKSFDVKGDRWRYSTSMKSAHFKKGDVVKVEVIGDDDTVYATGTLNIE